MIRIQNLFIFVLGPSQDVNELEEIRGFDLSPVHQESPRGGGFDNSHTEDTEMYQPVTQVVSFTLS